MGTHLRKIFHDVISLEPDTNSSVKRVGSQTILVYVHRSTDRLSYRYQEIMSLSEEFIIKFDHEQGFELLMKESW